MKKIVTVLITLIFICSFFLTACSKECEHTYTDWKIVTKATCSQKGVKEKVCLLCDEKVVEYLDTINHTILIDNRIEPTYTQTGLTEGKHCGACGEILVEQKTIPKIATLSIINNDDIKRYPSKYHNNQFQIVATIIAIYDDYMLVVQEDLSENIIAYLKGEDSYLYFAERALIDRLPDLSIVTYYKNTNSPRLLIGDKITCLATLDVQITTNAVDVTITKISNIQIIE